MVETVIINTVGEEKALIPDKWVLGTGLSTNQLYILHMAPPLMIVQVPSVTEGKSGERASTIYLTGEVDPESLNRLFTEAWKILEIYKNRF